MALERPPGAIEFMFRIKVQHYPCNPPEVSAFRNDLNSLTGFG
jgi:hypothetical protein